LAPFFFHRGEPVAVGGFLDAVTVAAEGALGAYRRFMEAPQANCFSTIT
jgi:hypothetical protein